MKKKKQNVLIMGITVIILLVVCISYTFARYVADSLWNYYLMSKGFYFNVDNLGLVNDSWNFERIYFSVRNNQSDTVITDYDISYSVVCEIEGEASLYAECDLNSTSLNTYNGTLSAYEACFNETDDGIPVNSYDKTTCDIEGYTWKRGIALSNIYFDIVLTDPYYEITDLAVNITVKSTSPYSKTLKGSFILTVGIVDDELKLDYKNYTNNGNLIISNSYYENKCVKITWNSANLLIQEDKNNFESFDTDLEGYINEIIFMMDAKSSKSYIFYPRDFGESYDKNEFLMEESNACS